MKQEQQQQPFISGASNRGSFPPKGQVALWGETKEKRRTLCGHPSREWALSGQVRAQGTGVEKLVSPGCCHGCASQAYGVTPYLLLNIA